MLPYTHTPVAAREKPSARHINAIGAEVAALSKIIRGAKGADGIDVAVNSGGLLLALLAGARDRFVIAKLVAAPPALVPVKPSLCRYSARGLDIKIEVADVLPDYGRSVVNDECDVYPDLVGNLCFIVRNPQAGGTKKAQLWVWSEITCKGECA